MLELEIIWLVAAACLLLALILWTGLMITHLRVMRSQRRIQQYQDLWLERLLPIMEQEEQADEKLPRPASAEEMEAVLGLLRDLAERFRGQYRENLSAVLDQIGASAYGCRLMRSSSSTQRHRGAALLAWCGPDPEGDAALINALDDREPRVRLEAATGVVRKQLLDDPRPVIESLCRDRAAHSLMARDTFFKWGSMNTQVDWAGCLQLHQSAEALVLLLEAAGAAARPEWTESIAEYAKHDHPKVAIASLQALAQLGDPLGAQSARLACSNPDARVRRQAAATLAICGDLEADGDCLLRLLDDPNFETRQAALKSLKELGGMELVRARKPSDDWQRELYQEAGLLVPDAP